MFQRSAGYGLVPAAPLKEFLNEVEGFVLLVGAPGGCESIGFVARKSAGHIAAHVAVASGGTRAVHKKFGAVVDLRNSAACQKECDGLFPPTQVIRLFEQETVGVVVVEEGQYMGRVGEKIVEGKMVVDCVEALKAVGLSFEGIAGLYAEHEVHDSRQARIAVGIHL